VTLTYLGVAGWQIDGGSATLLTDPYLSRPDLDNPVASDPAAVAAHAPRRADAILVGHSHVDHLLDAPSVALRTGAQLIGSESTASYARASGVADDHIIAIKGGEDYDFGTFSIRVIPSLHGPLDHKHGRLGGAIAAGVTLPLTVDQFAEGGTFAYLIRIAGHEIVVLDTGNFIERELAGLHPDIAIVVPDTRDEVHDYTCRLLYALGDPPLVYATHFDDWRAAPADVPPEDLEDFADQVARCSPHTTVIVPKHFVAMTVP
jgi:L-ascorbate metabolism protein UlaG (beta-lactamase superfamily)